MAIFLTIGASSRWLLVLEAAVVAPLASPLSVVTTNFLVPSVVAKEAGVIGTFLLLFVAADDARVRRDEVTQDIHVNCPCRGASVGSGHSEVSLRNIVVCRQPFEQVENLIFVVNLVSKPCQALKEVGEMAGISLERNVVFQGAVVKVLLKGVLRTGGSAVVLVSDVLEQNFNFPKL